MASHKKKDSDTGALGAIGGQSGYQSIADDGDVVGDNSQATPPDPNTPKTKKVGVFRRLSRSVRKAFRSDIDEENDPEIKRMETREKRWRAQAEMDVNGPFTEPDINFYDGPGRSFFQHPSSPSRLSSNHDSKLVAEEALQRIHDRNTVGEREPYQQARPQQPKPIRSKSVIQPALHTRPARRYNTMSTSLGRSASLSQRFPGDMSHRPLEQIKRENKAAHRGHHLRKNTLPRADPIDTLDNILGHSYHHEGPFDATLASRNANKKYAPLEAVKRTNEEALKATPRELVQDSLTKHVPLHGTANIPPGMSDISGRRMSYEEGTDLQRERFASGGPSRRYDDVDYHPDDLKGKGEPSYTLERAFKHGKSASVGDGPGVYEMQPRDSSKSSPSKNGDVMVRQRSRSSSFGEGPSGSAARATSTDSPFGGSSSSSPGKRITTGLKKRIGSIRRKAGRDT